MRALRLSDSGVEIKPLDPENLPGAARHLVETMEEVGRAHDILPHAFEATIIEHIKPRNMDPYKWRHSFRLPGEADELPGRTPTFEEVEKIHRKASERQEFNHEEVSWNGQVHLRLLESIFEQGLGGQLDRFNAMSWQNDRSATSFTPNSSTAKMIDICIYAAFDRDSAIHSKIMELSRTSPTNSINHTDFDLISTRPLLVSIATEKPGVHWDTAQLQVGVWHAAQWAFLRWAVGQKLLRQRVESNSTLPQTGEEEDEFQAQKLAVLSTLGFIPTVIVQGHRWHLVMSTYENGKTKLWAHRQFGTTQNCLETYATDFGIRKLTAWARDVYLPWFEANVL